MLASAEIESAAVPTILAISPCEEDRETLTGLFRKSHWNIVLATTVAEAAAELEKSSFPVVLCERNLPDGDWKDVLRSLMKRPLPPQLIVMDRIADDQLWSEVLNFGGFDVVTKPFTARELFPSINGAWRHWTDTLPRRGKKIATAEAIQLAAVR